ncbi:MAG TPA: sialate O-acetylesterase [Puia sp.]|jgi:hypothetical protein
MIYKILLAGSLCYAALYAGAQQPGTPPSDVQYPAEYSMTVSSRFANSKEKTYGEWKEYPTRTIETLQGYTTSAVPLDKYGGRTDKKFPATGFFHAVKEKDRWWVVDPEGNAFINIGMVNVSPASTEMEKEAMAKEFGDQKGWVEQTQNLLTECGFNALGAWSDVPAFRGSALENTKPLAYTIMKNFMSDYGKKRGGTYQDPGHTGYPDRTIFVFDPGFVSFCDEYAKDLAANRDDKNLFGYFSDNELPFERLSLDRYLGKKDSTDYGCQAARKWLAERNVQPSAITDSLRNEFLGYMAERYYAVVAAAIKKYDPVHLYLGSRLHSNELKVEPFFRVVGKYVDVIAINYYRVWTPVAADMKNWEAWSGRPFLITEWYTKGEDSRMTNYSGAGWIVHTQNDRGLFYQNFTLALLESKNCVGFQWFKYQDNDPTNTKADPSNTDANKGIVNTKYELYQPLVGKMRALNRHVYSLIDFFDKRDFDLYLLIGQSNMAGRAPLDSAGKQTDPLIWMLDKNNNWVPATDPVHFDKPDVAGVGPAISFAKEMLLNRGQRNGDHNDDTQRKIGLIPCAIGGSPIRVWEPDSTYLNGLHPYDDAIRRARVALQQGRLKGIIWHQGESDNNPQSAAIYMSKLQALILRLRKDLDSPDLPFVAGEIGYFGKGTPINAVIDLLPRTVPHTAVVSAEGLTDKGDKTHFDTRSARELGKRYGQAMKKLQK